MPLDSDDFCHKSRNPPPPQKKDFVIILKIQNIANMVVHANANNSHAVLLY